VKPAEREEERNKRKKEGGPGGREDLGADVGWEVGRSEGVVKSGSFVLQAGAY